METLRKVRGERKVSGEMTPWSWHQYKPHDLGSKALVGVITVNRAGLVPSETECSTWATEETTSTLSLEGVLYRNTLRLKRRGQQSNSPKKSPPEAFMASLRILFKGPGLFPLGCFFFSYSLYRSLHSLFIESSHYLFLLEVSEIDIERPLIISESFSTYEMPDKTGFDSFY